MRANPYKALLSFMLFNEAKISAFALAVIKGITGNAFFPDAAPLVALLVTAQQNYATALSAAKEGGRVQVAEKNASRIVLLDALRKLCDMVNYVAQGNRIALLSSSFDVSKEVVSPVVLEPAKDVVVKYGDTSGQMDVSVKGVKGHKGLVFEYAPADAFEAANGNVNWVSQPSGTTSFTLKNLPVGQKVVIRVGIAGARKQIIYTVPVTKMVA